MESLKEFDRQSAMGRMNNDWQLYQELFHAFCEDYDTILEDLARAIVNSDHELLVIASQMLNDMLVTLAADQCVYHSNALRLECARDNFKDGEKHFGSLRQAIERYIEHVRSESDEYVGG